MTASTRKAKEYSKFEFVFGNLAIILWISLGAFSCALFYPLAGFAYFVLMSFLIFSEIGKHGCVTCYYCKTCTIGIGKLPEFFFKQEGTTNVNRKAQRLFPFVFVLLSVVPLVLVGFSVIQELVFYKIVLFATILVFSVYNGIVRRKTLIARI